MAPLETRSQPAHIALRLPLHSWRLPHSGSVFSASFLVSLFFLLFGPYSNFGASGYLDPWFYTGYFTHFSYLLEHHGLTYYVSRLPWIIPGVLIFKVASPAAASVILNALILACSVTGLYLGVKWHYGELAAALACIALMTNPYFMCAVAWDYPDGPAIAYAFLAMAAFLRPVPGYLASYAVAGACLALSGYTNMAALPVLLGIAVIPLWRHRNSWKDLVKSVLAIGVGGSVVTAIFAIIAKPLLGLYLFYLPQVRMIRYTRAHPEYLREMWGTGYAWIPVAFRLFPVIFMLLLGAVLFLVKRKRRAVYAEAYLCLLVTSALFCLFEFGFHNTGLSLNYGSSYVVCPLLMFTGIFLGEYLSDLPITHIRWDGLARRLLATPLEQSLWTAVALFGAALPFVYAYFLWQRSSNNGLWARLFAGTLAGGALVAIFRRTPALLRAATCCLILAVLFFAPAFDTSLSNVWSAGNALVFDSIIKIEKVVDSGITSNRALMFWYDPEQLSRAAIPGSNRVKPQNLFASAHSLYLYGYVNLTRDLRSASAGEIENIIHPNTTFVHLTMDSDKTAERDGLLQSRGIVVGNDRRWVIPSPFGDIHVDLQDVIDESGLH